MRSGVHGRALPHRASHVSTALAGTAAVVPLDDRTAYLEYPQYGWMFNKILLREAQGLPAYPHGVEPPEVGHTGALFSQPIVNLLVFPTGAQVLQEWSLGADQPDAVPDCLRDRPEDWQPAPYVADRGRSVA